MGLGEADTRAKLIDPALHGRGWVEDLNAGAGVKTNLLFFTKGQPTRQTWYFDLSDIKVGKKTPLTIEKFGDFFELLPKRAASQRSWTVTRKEIEARNFDLKAVNPNARSTEDTRTPEELIALIEAKGREVSAALAALKGQGNSVIRGGGVSL
jgi:type I restriction enzyme M protein